jgi:RNA processing factor Prp31
MYISYFEFRKILSELEKEYNELKEKPRVQTDTKFAIYSIQNLKRIDKEVKSFIQKKYNN